MTCKKDINITIDWIGVVQFVRAHKSEQMWPIAIGLEEIESRVISITKE